MKSQRWWWQRLMYALAVSALATTLVGVAVAAPSKVTVGFASPILAGQPDQQALLLGQQKVAALLGWKVTSLDAQLSADKQISDIDTLVSKKVQGISTFAIDPRGLEPALKRARQARIPVIGFNSRAPSVTTVIRQELFFSCNPGRDAARFIASLKPGAKVIVIGGPPVPVIEHVVGCFISQAKAAGLRVLDRQDNVKDQAATAQPIATDLITKHPDVDAVWAVNDTTAAGVASALLAAGRTIKSARRGGVILVSASGGNTLGASAVKAGRQTATYDQGSLEAGAAAIRALATVYVKHRPVSAMPRSITIPVHRYDFRNISTYVPFAKRDLSRFAR